MKQILIAGIGNIFHGDDAFGVEVARQLSGFAFPPEVRVIDFGIRSYDLAYALTGGCDAAILVDALPRGGPPGTVYLIEPDLEQLAGTHEDLVGDAHAMNPLRALQLAKTTGELPAQLYLVGCEPAKLDCEEGQLGLSESVRAAIPQAVGMITSLVDELLGSRIENNAGLMPDFKETLL